MKLCRFSCIIYAAILTAVAGKCGLWDVETAEAIKFLNMHRPARDLGLSQDYLGRNVRLAMTARVETIYGCDVPFDLFLNNVLPYAVMTEPRESWRQDFYTKLAPLVKNASSTKEAVLAVAAGVWDAWGPPTIKFVAAPPDAVNAYSPLQVLAGHNASCTGLAVFFADACRSVGLPARVAGTPHWNKGKKECPLGDADPNCGNHDWNEVRACVH